MIRTCLLSAAFLGAALAQEPPKPDAAPPPPPPEGRDAKSPERPPLPPGEQRERPPGGPEGREGGERRERPPFPPPGGLPGGERRMEGRPDGFPPRDGERNRGPEDQGPGNRGPENRRPENRGPENRRFGGDFRSGQPGFPGGEFGGQPRMNMKPTPYLGIITTPAPPVLSAQLGLTEGFGLVVEDVMPDSPAKTAGLQQFDVLKQLNDQQLLDPNQLGALVRSLGKDKEVAIVLVRKGQEQKVTVKIGEKEMPERRMDDTRNLFSFPFGNPDMRRNGDISRGSSDQGREYQERMRAMEEKMRDYQRTLNEWQENLKKWHQKPDGDMPPRPPFPSIEGGRQRPTGANEPGDNGSRFDSRHARVTMRDRDGESELNTKDGQRTLTVRNSAGEVVFTGPVETPEQRKAIPENYRGKLESLEAVPKPSPGQPSPARPSGPAPGQPGQSESRRQATPV